jgi:drug/metabolite transporter (DMT)-like permease
MKKFWKLEFIFMTLWSIRWFGIIGIIGGEVGNLIAYGYAPAAIVTPIGAIGVLTNVLITTVFLKERIRKLNILGMCAVVGGIVVTVYFAPKTEAVFSSDTFWNDVIATEHGISYFVLFAVSALIMISINRYFGDRSVVIPVFTSSIFGSLTILSAKTFSSLFTKAVAEGFDKYFLSPVPYIAFLVMIGTCVVTMAFINTAMTKFGNCQVVPTYYALFTALSVSSVGLVFREFDCLTEAKDASLFVAGIVLAICGVSLVQVLTLSNDQAISSFSIFCFGMTSEFLVMLMHTYVAAAAVVSGPNCARRANRTVGTHPHPQAGGPPVPDSPRARVQSAHQPFAIALQRGADRALRRGWPELRSRAHGACPAWALRQSPGRGPRRSPRPGRSTPAVSAIGYPDIAARRTRRAGGRRWLTWFGGARPVGLGEGVARPGRERRDSARRPRLGSCRFSSRQPGATAA